MAKMLLIIPADFDMSPIKPSFGFKVPKDVLNVPIMDTQTFVKVSPEGKRLFVKFHTQKGSFLLSEETLATGGLKAGFEFEAGTQVLSSVNPVQFALVNIPKPKVAEPKGAKPKGAKK